MKRRSAVRRLQRRFVIVLSSSLCYW